MLFGVILLPMFTLTEERETFRPSPSANRSRARPAHGIEGCARRSTGFHRSGASKLPFHSPVSDNIWLAKLQIVHRRNYGHLPMARSESDYLLELWDKKICPFCREPIKEGKRVGTGRKKDGGFCSLGCYTRYYTMNWSCANERVGLRGVLSTNDGGKHIWAYSRKEALANQAFFHRRRSAS